MSEANSQPTPDVLEAAAVALRDLPIPSGPPPELAASTIAAIADRAGHTIPSAALDPRLERRRRMFRYLRYGSASIAAAAVIAVAAVLWMAEKSPAAIFNAAIENAEKAQSLRAVITTSAGDMKMEMKQYVQGDKTRIEMDMGPQMGSFVVIADGSQKKMLQLFHKTRTVKWLSFDDAEGAKKMAKDVAGVSGLLSGLKGKKVESLPDETVDGRKLKVFTMKGHELKEFGGTADLTAWIDPRTERVVRLRNEMKRDGMTVVSLMDVLGWNEELDPALFKLEVPAGYKLEGKE